MPGLNISGRKFKILPCSTQGKNFQLLGLVRAELCPELGGSVPVLTVPDHYLWEKDKTHSGQALSDVQKMLW